MKINAKIHGIIDYLVVVFLLAAPSLFNLPDITSTFTYVLAGVHLALTVLTAYGPGLINVIPLKVHGWIELIVAVALVGIAFYLGSLEDNLARNFYLCFAAAVFLTWLITDYKNPAQELLVEF